MPEPGAQGGGAEPGTAWAALLSGGKSGVGSPPEAPTTGRAQAHSEPTLGGGGQPQGASGGLDTSFPSPSLLTPPTHRTPGSQAGGWPPPVRVPQWQSSGLHTPTKMEADAGLQSSSRDTGLVRWGPEDVQLKPDPRTTCPCPRVTAQRPHC